MNTFHSRRAAASCGAAALLLGAGMLVPLSAQAAGSDLGGVGSTVAGATTPSTPSGSTGVVGSTVGSTVGSVVTTATSPAPSASSGGLSGVIDSATSTTATSPGSSTSVLDLVDVNTGSAAAPVPGAVVVPGVVGLDPNGLLGGGSGGTGTGGGTGGGGITVTLGSTPDGGSLASVGTGGSAGGSGGVDGTSTTTTTSSITNNYGTGTTVGAPAAADPAAPAAPSAAPAASAAPVRVLGVGATPSVGTVYPARDGYRDDVVFRIASRTSSATTKAAVTGTAVLTRGSKAITQWTISQPTQDLRWNGLDHGKLVAGDYVLSATVQDAAGTTHSTSTKVVASAKRLVPSVQKVSSLSTTGRHTMAAAARAGLSKGAVTLRLTTVATKVTGKHFLVFVKGAKQFRIPITKGTHTTKAVVVPKAFTSYTLKHTWKKGQVKLKSIRYTYSYQSLR